MANPRIKKPVKADEYHKLKGTPFDRVQKAAKDVFFRKGIASRTTTSQNWYVNNIKKIVGSPTPAVMHRNEKRMIGDAMPTGAKFIGNMFLYTYDPKHKLTLPYYDRYPLVIPIKTYADGFLGLNLHYLPITLRAEFFQMLLGVTTDKKFGDRTRFKLTYDFLNGASRLSAFRPCLHRYLTGHIRSKILKVPAEDWEIAIFLPVHNFEKATARTVWRHSRRMINENKMSTVNRKRKRKK
jgi:hypothetical protein